MDKTLKRGSLELLAARLISGTIGGFVLVSGQSVIDAGGLVGQIIQVRPMHSTVLLLTDPDHAVPVEVARSGVRLVAYGRGDGIALANVARTADIRVGDVVQTSGLGGRFPPGFKVGTVQSLRPDDSRAFLTGALLPAAGLDRGREVLLLREVRRPLPAAARAPGATGTAPDMPAVSVQAPAAPTGTEAASPSANGANDAASPAPRADAAQAPSAPVVEPAR